MESVPSYLTSPVEALKRAENLEAEILRAAEGALAEFLELVGRDALAGDLARGSVMGYWTATLHRALAHPAFAAIRDELLAELANAETPDDAFSVAELALTLCHEMQATDAERAELITVLFRHPAPASLLASLSARVDGWLRRRISALLLKRINTLGPDDLLREDLEGPLFDIPTGPGSATTVTEEDWFEDDRPGEINWRARMRRDIRTAYTAIFGRQMQRQLERYGFPAKKWVSRKDERVRATHRHANGQVVGIYESFAVGASFLRFPGDPTGPAAEVVNCRCVIIGAS